jgi:hypothetical protein
VGAADEEQSLTRNWIAVLLFLIPACLPGAGPKVNVEKTTTENADLPPGGTLRIEDSYGELNIEAWDEPGVRMVVTLSAWVSDIPAARDRVTKELSDIHIASEKQGNYLVIRSPRHPRFRRDGRLDYRILVPRTARLYIRHDIGDVVIGGVTGSIDAAVKTGDILLRLDGAASYSFDAYVREGRVHSDFAGTWRRHHYWAEGYTANGSSAAVSVKLHAGIGGIDIRKLQTVPPPS